MSAQPLAVANTGLVTSVGLNAPAACAAMRAGLANLSETRFINSMGELISGHAVPLTQEWRGRQRLLRMASMAATECLTDVEPERWSEIPLLLCVAEEDRPGRAAGLDGQFLTDLYAAMDTQFAEQSRVVPYGHASAAVALLQARRLIYEAASPAVLVVAVDSLLTWPTLREFDRQQRLLATANSNGFLPGEGAAAVLLAKPSQPGQLCITGLGFGQETATMAKDEPLRAEGLSRAINDALADAGCAMHDMDFRIADVSGEQYYFKEATLALSRVLKRRKETFDIWHPADCIGETGSAIGPAMLAVASASVRKGYAPGTRILLHTSNDAGQRAAMVAWPLEN
jgi:3-oxoacyl-[acyl-carrier-protein] synthase I